MVMITLGIAALKTYHHQHFEMKTTNLEHLKDMGNRQYFLGIMAVPTRHIPT